MPIDTDNDGIMATNITSSDGKSHLVGFSGIFDEVVLTTTKCDLCNVDSKIQVSYSQ